MKDRAVSIKLLADRLSRHPMLSGTPFETIVDYVLDFIRIEGIPQTLENKIGIVDIEDYRGQLPCDCIEVISARTYDNNKFSYRYTTDTFHTSELKGRNTDLTYKIQGDIMFTSNKCGKVEIAYTSIAVDDDGFPMIPENSKFMRAAELYVKLRVFTIQFDEGKISQAVLQNTQQEYYFAVGACESEYKMLTYDEAESVFNVHQSLVPRKYEHMSQYVNSGMKELLKIH